MKLIKNEQPTMFVRIIGVVVMLFGMLLVYTATAKMQTISGSAFVAVALGIMIPAQVNTAFAICIGALRSLGIVKRALEPERQSGEERRSNPKLGSTVSARLEDIEKDAES
jgi:hypothetical protein